MKRQILLWLAVTGLTMTVAAQRLTSPNGKLTVEVSDGQWLIGYGGQQVLTVKDAEAVASGKMVRHKKVKADYTMLSGKRSHCTNEANEYRLGPVTLRLYNDGLAYRYEQPVERQAAYVIPEGMRRWMMQWTDGAEGFYPLTTTYKVKAQRSFSAVTKDADGYCLRWSFPVLLEASPGPSQGGKPVFALLTEANIEKGQSAASLYNDGELYRVVPDEGENRGRSPWRVVIVGTLADVVESTLVTDVSDPCKLDDSSWIKPGVVSWVYWAYNHGSNDYHIIKKYVDLAATLKLPYVLIDAEWDTFKDGKSVEDAIGYARSQGVRPMIWYNSSVGWVDGAPTPKFRLNKAEDREKEFAWCEKAGVAGVKVDFFSGENQRNMDYCIDLMESAARHHLLINFHGATVPRGWQRTYPNLLSTEGVYGAEWYNNVPTFTAKAAAHNATLPFTRNVVGPMDYTPCAFSDSQHPHITTHAHELALTVLFESGLQHLADRPESLLAQPAEVQRFFGHLPAAWDDTRLLDGYPGEYCVMARRHGQTWYVAAINGSDEPKSIALAPALKPLAAKGRATLFLDGDTQPWDIRQGVSLPATLTCKPRGGFVAVISR